MRYLIDTHLLIWSQSAPEHLPPQALAIIGDTVNDVTFSIASMWETAIKFALRRPDFDVDPRILRRALLDSGFVELPVEASHIFGTIDLPPLHRDPFDRLLVAQARAEGIVLVTSDAKIARYDPGIVRV